jgi:hypothetical protein
LPEQCLLNEPWTASLRIISGIYSSRKMSNE